MTDQSRLFPDDEDSKRQAKRFDKGKAAKRHARRIRQSRLQAAFEHFHARNPSIYALCKQYALQVKDRGFAHYSINAIFERVRWFVFIETVADDGFKLNNNHRAYYSRLLMEQEPELEGFFSIREIGE